MILLIAFVLHFIGDFLFQARFIANNKSKDIYMLLLHGMIYTTMMLVLTLFDVHIYNVLWIGITHIATDYITSKAITYFYKKEDWWAFFSVIGFDQLLHTIQILYFLSLLG